MAFPAGWTRRAPIVIAAVESALTDFPVHLDASCFPAEALDSGSSDKAASDGADLRFSADSSGTTELPFEVVRWVQDASAPNRRATVHVLVPALSATATTTIYVWYGNGAASMPAVGDANGRNAVWASYAHVLHLDSTSAATDATGGSAWTLEGTPAATYEGPAGLMLDLDGTDDAVQGPSYNPSDHLLEFLVRCDATSNQIIVGRSLTGGAAHISESVWVSSNKPTAFIDTDGALTYGHTLADTINASTTTTELWQVRNRSTAGGQVVTMALPTQEQTHQAHASDGTYLYSIGGHQGNPAAPITNNNRYDPSGNSWSSLTAIPVARWGMASVHLGGKIYCFAGATTLTTGSDRTDIYDIAGDSWSAGATCPSDLVTTYFQGLRSVTDGTYIYVCSVQEFWRYDPGADSWLEMTPLPRATGAWQSMICDGTYIYVWCGSNKLTNVDRYTISTDSWDGGAGYDTAPYGAWAQVCEPLGGGEWLVGFGRVGSSLEQRRDLYKYAPGTKTWTRLPSYDMPCNAMAAGVYSGKLYVYGGWCIGSLETYSFGHHACFDTSDDEWETLPAVAEFSRADKVLSGKILTAAPYAGNGRWYVGRQDGLTSTRSGATVGELRISASARSRAWMSASHSTLITASTFAVVGAAGNAASDATAPGSTTTATASLLSGAGQAESSAAGVTLPATMALQAGAAAAESAAPGALLSPSVSLLTGTASGTGDATAPGATLTFGAGLVAGAAQAASQASGQTLALTASLIAGAASGASGGTAPGALLQLQASLLAGGVAVDAVAMGTLLSVAAQLQAGSAEGDTAELPMRPSAPPRLPRLQAATRAPRTQPRSR